MGQVWRCSQPAECCTATRMYIITTIHSKTLCEISQSSYPHALNCSTEAERTKQIKQHSNVEGQQQTLRVDYCGIIVTLILEGHQVPSHLHP